MSSRHQSRQSVIISETPEILEIIREEQCTPVTSSVDINASKTDSLEKQPCSNCFCKQDTGGVKFDPAEIEKMLKDKEIQLRAQFEQELNKEMSNLKERFDFILQNEQTRTSYMLREAHRERQEKIQALQTQLECKNLAGLMYVMCSERKKGKLEKLRIIEEYTNYIHALQDILNEGQALILHLSRGYKTAARVDQEWRAKMNKIINEFQCYVYHFAGGSPETNQYIFDLPAILKTESPIVDDPNENPCTCEEEDETITEPESKKTWYEKLDGDCRPFVMFGDMAEFKPPQRREVLRTVKAAKTAPNRWREYVFNEMFINRDCPNADTIKDEYPKHMPTAKWECPAQAQDNQGRDRESSYNEPETRRRYTSVDVRGIMGSILRLIATSSATSQPKEKSTLLGARDSLEITSTTKLREKHRESHDYNVRNKQVSISIGRNKSSKLHDLLLQSDESADDEARYVKSTHGETNSKFEVDDFADEKSCLGSIHQDSLDLISKHVPDADRTINYEKTCPMDKCQRMQVDSFIRTLPPYMRASPFTHFEQTYEEYETCSPEQLEILKHRIEAKQRKESHAHEHIQDPLVEWKPSTEGVAIQTSEMSVDLPPCTCRAPSPTPASSHGRVYDVEDLIPMKEALDFINKKCLYDDRIQFDRFKVIGQTSNDTMCNDSKHEFKETRLNEIKKILKKHPSLLDMFQANTQC